MRPTTETTTILGVDAAWTANEPSGVALAQRTLDRWRCIAVAPSYDQFCGAAEGHEVDWEAPCRRGTPPDVLRLHDAASELAGTSVDVIAVDMPVATVSIMGRRDADRAVSREFGSRLCAAHSPNADRPGQIGTLFSSQARDLGFDVATTCEHVTRGKSLVEVYPHPALLSLLARDCRVKYKTARTLAYWPGRSVRGRIAELLTEYRAIHDALVGAFGDVGFELPSAERVPSLAWLKRYEDALVCTWVGTQYAEGQTVPLGNETAAVWCPCDVVRGTPAPASRIVSPD